MSHRSFRAAGLALALALLWASPLGAAAPEPARSRTGMVVTPHPEATRAGVAALEAGGNAIDAAVAAAFAMAVTQPQSNGIGGGAFVLVRLADGRAFALDARETAPAASTPDMYLQPGLPERPSLLGGLAVGTPGMVAGMALALEKWGTQSLAQALGPSIALAAEGYEVGSYQQTWVDRLSGRSAIPRFSAVFAKGLRTRFGEMAAIHMPEDATEPGWVLRQPDLAKTLSAIAADGPRAFYEGEIARAIAEATQKHGGILTAEDLAAYRPVVREPVRGTYRGLEVLSFPPPSSGGVAVVQVLNLVEGFDLRGFGAGSSAAIHHLAEAMKLAFADRAAHLGDPDFTPVPVEKLTSEAYADELRARIHPDRVAVVDGPGIAPRDDQGTAHLSVTDAAGNAVAITSTINGPFGSMVMVPGTGILLNNEMDDFTTDPNAPNLYGLVGTTSANLVEPGKRPLSSMAPTIATKDGKVRFVGGSNGGPRIITATLLSMIHVVDHDMDVQEAVSAPRFHHQWRPDVLQLEGAHPADVVEALRARGHEVKVADELVTGVEAIVVGPDGTQYGAPDPRRNGLAAGPAR